MRRSPQQVRPAMHQRGARVPSGVQFDMPYPRLHGVPPVPRQDDRRVRFAGLVAHHILVRTRPKGQSFRRLTCLGRSKHGHEAIRQWQYSSGCRRPRVVRPSGSPPSPCCSRRRESWRQGRHPPIANRQSHLVSGLTVQAPTRGRVGRLRPRQEALNLRLGIGGETFVRCIFTDISRQPVIRCRAGRWIPSSRCRVLRERC